MQDSGVFLMLQRMAFNSELHTCMGIAFPGEIRKSDLRSEATREILILNQSGIEIESPKTHGPLHISFGSWTREGQFGYYENLLQYRIGYPEGYSAGGRKRTVGYTQHKHHETQYRNFKLDLKPGAACVLRFRLGDVATGSLSTDSFGIIVKAAARQPLIGIWRWDTLERMQDRLEWSRKRRYPTFAATEGGGIIRIALRYIDQTPKQASQDAAFVITLEDDDTSSYTACLPVGAPDQTNAPDQRRAQAHELSIRSLLGVVQQQSHATEREANINGGRGDESDVTSTTIWDYEDLLLEFMGS